MSVEEAVTNGLQQPMDNNAQAAEDAKKMLAELKGEAESQKAAGIPQSDTSSKPAVTEPEKAGSAAKETGDEKPSEGAEKQSEEQPEDSRSRHRHDRGGHRGGRGGRGGGGGGRGRGGFNSKNFKENIKSDLTTAPETDDPREIRKQVEFYFSDSNLPMDKFLLEQVGGSKNNPVKIETLHSFKRMRRFQPFSAIVSALKDSKVLEVTDDDTCVRRKTPLPEALDNGPDEEAVKVFEDRAMPRSVYAKGFGDEVPSTQFDIEAFFAPYGPTNAIRLRRNNEKAFKGSVFVEFESEDLQKEFLTLDPKPKYKGTELQIMSKKQYCDQKVEDIKAGKIQSNSVYDRDRRYPGKSDRKFGDHKRKRDDEDNRDWRDRRDEDRRNGFRDDKKKNYRDRDSRGGRGTGANRSYRTERDDRGIPVVKETQDDSTKNKLNRDAATTEALANAKAMVEAETKKDADADGKPDGKHDGGAKVESAEQEQKPFATETAKTVEKGIQADAAETTGKKRAREDDEGEAGRGTKKVNIQTESDEVANGGS